MLTLRRRRTRLKLEIWFEPIDSVDWLVVDPLEDSLRVWLFWLPCISHAVPVFNGHFIVE